MDSNLNIINRLPQKSKTEYFFDGIPDDGIVLYLYLYCNNKFATLSYRHIQTNHFTILAEGELLFVGLIDFFFEIRIKDFKFVIKQILDSTKPNSFIAVVPGFGERYFVDINI